MKKHIIIIFSLFFITCSPKLGYPWYKGSVESALNIAEDKAIMLDFYADW